MFLAPLRTLRYYWYAPQGSQAVAATHPREACPHQIWLSGPFLGLCLHKREANLGICGTSITTLAFYTEFPDLIELTCDQHI